MLQANPNLGWRDVREIVYSSRHVGSAVGAARIGYEDNAWGFNGADNWNGGGLHFSNDYGFGLVDAGRRLSFIGSSAWSVGSTWSNEAGDSVLDSGPAGDSGPSRTGITTPSNVVQNIDRLAPSVLDYGCLPPAMGDLITTSPTEPSGTSSSAGRIPPGSSYRLQQRFPRRTQRRHLDAWDRRSLRSHRCPPVPRSALTDRAEPRTTPTFTRTNMRPMPARRAQQNAVGS